MKQQKQTGAYVGLQWDDPSANQQVADTSILTILT